MDDDVQALLNSVRARIDAQIRRMETDLLFPELTEEERELLERVKVRKQEVEHERVLSGSAGQKRLPDETPTRAEERFGEAKDWFLATGALKKLSPLQRKCLEEVYFTPFPPWTDD